MNELLSCYRAGLARTPGLQGYVLVTYSVSQQGHVSHVEADGNLPDEEVKRCAADVFRRLRFPPLSATGLTANSTFFLTEGRIEEKEITYVEHGR